MPAHAAHSWHGAASEKRYATLSSAVQGRCWSDEARHHERSRPYSRRFAILSSSPSVAAAHGCGGQVRTKSQIHHRNVAAPAPGTGGDGSWCSGRSRLDNEPAASASFSQQHRFELKVTNACHGARRNDMTASADAWAQTHKVPVF